MANAHATANPSRNQKGYVIPAPVSVRVEHVSQSNDVIFLSEVEKDPDLFDEDASDDYDDIDPFDLLCARP